jgi:hypothetical protein
MYKWNLSSEKELLQQLPKQLSIDLQISTKTIERVQEEKKVGKIREVFLSSKLLKLIFLSLQIIYLMFINCSSLHYNCIILTITFFGLSYNIEFHKNALSLSI